MNKHNAGWIFATIALGVCLIVSIVLGLNGYFFSVAFSNQKTDLVVGEGVVLGIKENQAQVVSFTFDGNFLPGEAIPQVVQICASNANKGVVLRVRGQIFGIEESLGFAVSEEFEERDGFYYSKNILKSGGKVAFCSHLVVPEDAKFVCGEKYVLTIVVEALDSDLDWQNIWKNAE